MREFKAFILRGNVVDLAVGVVVGAAFGAVVTALVTDVLTPLLGLLKLPDFSSVAVHVGKGEVRYGLFLNAVISFVVIAAAVFFFIVKPVNRLTVRRAGNEQPTMRECPFCLSTIPIAATACAHCTRDVANVTP